LCQQEAEGVVMESRLAEIEIKLSFNEDLLDDLNRIVARQQQSLSALESQVRELRIQLQRSMPSEQSQQVHEIPPHY
jgi:SlyX protein